MKQLVTTGIILSRTDFGEADRILTVITPDQGKLRLMAKGVRKVKSKLAGGIELFSVSTISFIEGRSDIHTIVSTRLLEYYEHIVKDINRTMFGYELLKTINRVTEDNPGREYFELLRQALTALNDEDVMTELISFWLYMQLLKIAGHAPNFKTDNKGDALDAQETYGFDFDAMAFSMQDQGKYKAQHIKALRLVIGLDTPVPLAQVQDMNTVLLSCLQLSKTMLARFVRI